MRGGGGGAKEAREGAEADLVLDLIVELVFAREARRGVDLDQPRLEVGVDEYVEAEDLECVGVALRDRERAAKRERKGLKRVCVCVCVSVCVRV